MGTGVLGMVSGGGGIDEGAWGERMDEAAVAEIRASALGAAARAQTPDELESVRLRFLGRKGKLTAVLRGLRDLPDDLRRRVGMRANEAREMLVAALDGRRAELVEAAERSRRAGEALDVTLPGRPLARGRLHPVTRTLDECERIFAQMGFSVEEGPEVELDYYNFQALNIPKGHPARDMQDTFYVSEDVVLRTHTSPVQVRTMEKRRPPVRIIVPGKVYRSDASDASHSPIFHQLEGLAVDRGVTFADLKGTLDTFARMLFGSDTRTRFRPSYFPFTEPSAEVDLSCVLCKGSGCKLCAGTGWLEILGAGMVHPAVLENVGYDPEVYSGFAFGMGADRLAMLRYGIDDIRLVFDCDVRFLEQF